MIVVAVTIIVVVVAVVTIVGVEVVNKSLVLMYVRQHSALMIQSCSGFNTDACTYDR